ncbi:hypothetical protein GCM10027280_16970 [Micromonospora polyrhachis]
MTRRPYRGIQPWRIAAEWGEEVMSRKLVRPRAGRMVAGVCAGLAQRFGISTAMVRLLFLLSLLIPGSQVIIYLALWIIMPNEDRYLSHASH